ncbi:hypothetical protein GMMP15_230005 [Candidatus Magnetomoraceae bacterium gMMP-15]
MLKKSKISYYQVEKNLILTIKLNLPEKNVNTRLSVQIFLIINGYAGYTDNQIETILSELKLLTVNCSNLII